MGLRVVSLLRILGGLVCLALLFCLMIPPLVVLLPFRRARILVTNFFGTIIGRMVMAFAGCEVTVEGREHVRSDRPAIYACNHTSILDAFTTIWLTPYGTVGVAKKEVFYYPFYGQLWWLAGHLFLDRQRTDKAKAALLRTGDLVRKLRLHVCILPEGTRSTTGRLLPFKKGIVHLALQTKLPIVPMIATGLTNVWQKNSLLVRPAAVHVRFLPPISTEGWTADRIDEQLAELRSKFIEALPPEMRPEPTTD
jgi:1-acyl-sn-glycerol-3-phosphate acyltransferase